MAKDERGPQEKYSAKGGVVVQSWENVSIEGSFIGYEENSGSHPGIRSRAQFQEACGRSASQNANTSARFAQPTSVISGRRDEKDSPAAPPKRARLASEQFFAKENHPEAAPSHAAAATVNKPGSSLAASPTRDALADLPPNQDPLGDAALLGATTPEERAAWQAVDAAADHREAAEAEMLRLQGDARRKGTRAAVAAFKMAWIAKLRTDAAYDRVFAELVGDPASSASSAAPTASASLPFFSRHSAVTSWSDAAAGHSAAVNGTTATLTHSASAGTGAADASQVHPGPATTLTAPPLQQTPPPLVGCPASPHHSVPLVKRPQQLRPAPLTGKISTGRSVMHSRNSSPRPFNKVHTKVSEQIPMLSTAPLPHGKFEIGGHAAAPVSLSGGRARISGTKTDGASGDLMTEREQLKMGGTDERFRGTRVGEAALTGASEKEDEEARAGSKAVGGMAGYGSAYGQALEPEAEEPEEGEIRPDEEEQECQGTLGGRAAVLGGGGRKVEQSKNQLRPGFCEKNGTDSTESRSASASTAVAPLLLKTLFDKDRKTHELLPPVETVDHCPEKLSNHVPSHAHGERGKQPPRDCNARAEWSNADSAGRGERHTTSIETGSATYVPPPLRAKQNRPNPESDGAIEQRGAPVSPDIATPSSAPAPYFPFIRSGAFASIGSRAHMEDAHVTLDDVSGLLGARHVEASVPAVFFGVFDGHGGRDAAEYAGEHVLNHLLGDGGLPGDARAAFARAYLETDEGFRSACLDGKEEHSGTTALTALVFGRTLVVANAGDCRAVLCQKGRAVELSRDQKPGGEIEMKRILANGGFVEDGYLNGQLGVARAIGNWHMEEIKVKGQLTAEPEVKVWELGHEDEFLILGCDGLWDVMSSGMAVDLARKRLQQHNDPVRCSQELVEEAVKRHSADNITVVTICFQRDPPVRLSTAAPRAMRKSLSVESLRALQEKMDMC